MDYLSLKSIDVSRFEVNNTNSIIYLILNIEILDR